MAKIDLEKFICSFIERTQYRHLITEIQDALKDQGYEYLAGQIVEIQKPEEELTEFEKELSDFLYEWAHTTKVDDDTSAYIKDKANKLLSIARKQIAEETERKYKNLEVTTIVRKALEENGDYTNYRPDVFAARVGTTVESILRKQIIEDVPVDDMYENFSTASFNFVTLRDIYKKGILDTLEKIK